MKTLIKYLDNEKLSITSSTIIFNVNSINIIFGSLTSFAEKFNFSGITNGKLFILTNENHTEEQLTNLISNQLASLHFVIKRDYVFTYENNIDSYSKKIRKHINICLPEYNKVEWLGSNLSEKGLFVWYVEYIERELYVMEAMQKIYFRKKIKTYQPLLLKHIGITNPEKLQFNPKIVQLNKDSVTFELHNHKDRKIIKRQVLDNLKEYLESI